MTADSPDTIIFCQPATPYLCLGYHQVYDAVLDRARCEQLHLPVFRRQVGGGATYLDSNQLFYQCVFHHSRVPAVFTAVFARLLAGPVAALRRLGLDAALREINEIEVDGKRIAGTGGGQIGEACVVVGNVLFDFHYEAMTQVWRVPTEAFRELARRAMREHVVTLRQLGQSIDGETLKGVIAEEFSHSLERPLLPGALSAAEAQGARVMGARLSSPSFLALHADRPRKKWEPLKIAARAFIHTEDVLLEHYAVQASFYVSDGVIQEARLESDPPRVWKKQETRLQGAPIHDWRKSLDIQPM